MSNEFADKVLEHFSRERFNDTGADMERLQYEMGIANSDGGHFWMSLYRLVAKEFVGPQNHINSLLAYCVGVTAQPPDLTKPFSPRKDYILVRFSPPDIDCDFEDNGEIFEYLREKYGHNRVGNIGTYSSMKIKSAFQNSVKFEKINAQHLNLMYGFFLPNYSKFENKPKSWKKLKMDFDELSPEQQQRFESTIADSARLMTKILDLDAPEGGDTSNLGWDDLVEGKPINEELRKLFPSIFERAFAAVGMLVHKSSHAAGVVIVDQDINNVLPMHWVGKGEERRWATQWTMEDLEAAGYLKFDVLCVRSLEILHKAVNHAEQRMIRGGSVGTDFRIPIYQLKKNQDSVEKIMELYANGLTKGLFQFEGGGMTSFVEKMLPERFEDLVAATALFRPGPIKNGFHEEYVTNKNGDYSWKQRQANQAMYELLAKTHGLFVYQEQIMKATMILAGFTANEADELRKIIGKKLLDKMGPMREKFVARAAGHGVITAEQAGFYWDQFEKFGAYCFNESHSCAYTYLSYRLSYMKANFPTEFFCGLMSVELKHGNAQKKKDNLAGYMDEARAFGISFLPPDLNRSMAFDYFPEVAFDGAGSPTGHDSKRIVQPIAVIDAIGQNTAEAICCNAPYANFDEFVRGAGIGEKLFQDLVDTGICDIWLPEHGSRDNMTAYFSQMQARLKNKNKVMLKPPDFKGLNFKVVKAGTKA